MKGSTVCVIFSSSSILNYTFYSDIIYDSASVSIYSINDEFTSPIKISDHQKTLLTCSTALFIYSPLNKNKGYGAAGLFPTSIVSLGVEEETIRFNSSYPYNTGTDKCKNYIMFDSIITLPLGFSRIPIKGTRNIFIPKNTILIVHNEKYLEGIYYDQFSYAHTFISGGLTVLYIDQDRYATITSSISTNIALYVTLYQSNIIDDCETFDIIQGILMNSFSSMTDYSYGNITGTPRNVCLLVTSPFQRKLEISSIDAENMEVIINQESCKYNERKNFYNDSFFISIKSSSSLAKGISTMKFLSAEVPQFLSSLFSIIDYRFTKGDKSYKTSIYKGNEECCPFSSYNVLDSGSQFKVLSNNQIVMVCINNYIVFHNNDQFPGINEFYNTTSGPVVLMIRNFYESILYYSVSYHSFGCDTIDIWKGNSGFFNIFSHSSLGNVTLKKGTTLCLYLTTKYYTQMCFFKEGFTKSKFQIITYGQSSRLPDYNVTTNAAFLRFECLDDSQIGAIHAYYNMDAPDWANYKLFQGSVSFKESPGKELAPPFSVDRHFLYEDNIYFQGKLSSQIIIEKYCKANFIFFQKNTDAYIVDKNLIPSQIIGNGLKEINDFDTIIIAPKEPSTNVFTFMIEQPDCTTYDILVGDSGVFNVNPFSTGNITTSDAQTTCLMVFPTVSMHFYLDSFNFNTYVITTKMFTGREITTKYTVHSKDSIIQPTLIRFIQHARVGIFGIFTQNYASQITSYTPSTSFKYSYCKGKEQDSNYTAYDERIKTFYEGDYVIDISVLEFKIKKGYIVTFINPMECSGLLELEDQKPMKILGNTPYVAVNFTSDGTIKINYWTFYIYFSVLRVPDNSHCSSVDIIHTNSKSLVYEPYGRANITSGANQDFCFFIVSYTDFQLSGSFTLSSEEYVVLYEFQQHAFFHIKTSSELSSRYFTIRSSFINWHEYEPTQYIEGLVQGYHSIADRDFNNMEVNPNYQIAPLGRIPGPKPRPTQTVTQQQQHDQEVKTTSYKTIFSITAGSFVIVTIAITIIVNHCRRGRASIIEVTNQTNYTSNDSLLVQEKEQNVDNDVFDLSMSSKMYSFGESKYGIE
jgi:hypothetical protein